MASACCPPAPPEPPLPPLLPPPSPAASMSPLRNRPSASSPAAAASGRAAPPAAVAAESSSARSLQRAVDRSHVSDARCRVRGTCYVPRAGDACVRTIAPRLLGATYHDNRPTAHSEHKTQLVVKTPLIHRTHLCRYSSTLRATSVMLTDPRVMRTTGSGIVCGCKDGQTCCRKLVR